MNKKILWLVCGMAGILVTMNAYCYEIKGIELTPSLGLTESYDDNITFVKDDKSDDFITALSAGLKAKRVALTYGWALGLGVTHEFFAEHNKFDKTSEDVSFSFSKELSQREKVSLSDSFYHSYEPKSFAETFGRTLGRYSYYVNKFALEYAKELSRQWTVRTEYGNEVHVFSAGSGDSYLNTLRLQGEHALSSYSTLLFLYSFQARSFDPGESGYKNSLAAGLRQSITKQLTGELKAGVDVIDAYRDSNYTKPFVWLSLADEINQNTSARISFIKEYSLNPYTEDVFNSWEISAALESTLTKRLASRLSGFYGEGKYVGFDIQDTLSGAKAGVSYELKKDMSLDFDYEYTKVLSNDDGREYDKNKASCGLKMEF